MSLLNTWNKSMEALFFNSDSQSNNFSNESRIHSVGHQSNSSNGSYLSQSQISQSSQLSFSNPSILSNFINIDSLIPQTPENTFYFDEAGLDLIYAPKSNGINKINNNNDHNNNCINGKNTKIQSTICENALKVDCIENTLNNRTYSKVEEIAEIKTIKKIETLNNNEKGEKEELIIKDKNEKEKEKENENRNKNKEMKDKKEKEKEKEKEKKVIIDKSTKIKKKKSVKFDRNIDNKTMEGYHHCGLVIEPKRKVYGFENTLIQDAIWKQMLDNSNVHPELRGHFKANSNEDENDDDVDYSVLNYSTNPDYS